MKRTKINKKRPGFGHFFKKTLAEFLTLPEITDLTGQDLVVGYLNPVDPSVPAALVLNPNEHNI